MSTNKLSDRAIEAFLWIWELIYCVLALPLVLGLSWLVVGFVSDVLDVLYANSFMNPDLFYGISVIVGVCLKIWLTSRRRKQLRNGCKS